MTEVPPAIRALVEGKNAEVEQHHLAARIGDLQGSRVQAVRDVLDGWAPEEGTTLHTLWWQVDQATRLYEDDINNIRQEAYRNISAAGRQLIRDAIARELAEEIRAAWKAHDPKKPGNVCMLSALNAADFIDPPGRSAQPGTP